MVRDWQHAEGPLMRARMSDPDKRERWLSYMETHYTATVEETGVTPEDWVLNTAWGEARSILADAEPSDRGIFRSVRFLNAESGRMWAMEFLDERLALVESLRSFVEGN